MSRTFASLVLIVSVTSAGIAQDSGRALDSNSARARAAADTAGGRNWFVSLLRKIARKSDEADSVSVSIAPADTGATGSDVVAVAAEANARAFRSRKDSVSWESARVAAEKSAGYRVVVDIFDKQLFVIDGTDTLRSAPVATAMNASLEYGGRTWYFETPRGVRTVRAKDKDPVWTPPEWHFAEVASEHGLKVKQLVRGQVIHLKSGIKLLTHGDTVGIIRPGETTFEYMVPDEHIVFDNTLFIPPEGTVQRAFKGELGHFRLDMGNGYLLHGTPYSKSIGAAVTHGCVRLRDPDIEWLYENVPIGTKVYLY